MLTLIDLAGTEFAPAAEAQSVDLGEEEEERHRLNRSVKPEPAEGDISEAAALVQKRKETEKDVSKTVKESLKSFKVCVLALGNTRPENFIADADSVDTLTHLIKQNLRTDDKIYLMIHLNVAEVTSRYLTGETLGFGAAFRLLVATFLRRMAETRREDEASSEERPSHMSNLLHELKDEQAEGEADPLAKIEVKDPCEPAAPKTQMALEGREENLEPPERKEEKKIPSELVSKIVDLLSLPSEVNTPKAPSEAAVEATVSKINNPHTEHSPQKDSYLGSFFSKEESVLYNNIRRNTHQLHALIEPPRETSVDKTPSPKRSSHSVSTSLITPFPGSQSNRSQKREHGSWCQWEDSWPKNRSCSSADLSTAAPGNSFRYLPASNQGWIER